jgi:hypothetical protein
LKRVGKRGRRVQKEKISQIFKKRIPKEKKNGITGDQKPRFSKEVSKTPPTGENGY